MKALALATAAALLLTASASCKLKKKAGDACIGDEAVCANARTILECHDGQLHAMACSGPKGCTERPAGGALASRSTSRSYTVECDFSGAAAGEACLAETAMCDADRSRMIACKDRKIAVSKCLGAKKCTETEAQVSCDTSVQPVGEPCEGEDIACAPDLGQMLRCVGGKLAIAQNCRGPGRCTVRDRKVDCDPGPQSAGDPCATDGAYECSADGAALLRCAAGKWSVDEKCRKTCVTDGREVGCK